MRALVLENKKLEVRDIPIPTLSGNEVLIKVLKAGICDTDLELAKGFMNFKGVLGHEFVGQVVQESKTGWIGKRVVGEINIPCGKCEFCLVGVGNHCASRDVLGISRKNGAFAEFLSLPLENLHLLPESISDEEGVFVEPLAAALEILEQIRVEEKNSVLVLGDGKLGLLIAQVLKLKTDNVYSIGKHERKLEVLKRRGIRSFFRGEKINQKFDVVVEATGGEEGLNEALLWVKPRGKIVLKSTFYGAARINISKIVVDEIQIIGSRCGPFLKAIDILKRGFVEVKEMVDGDFPLDRAEEAFALACGPDIIKVLITP